MKHKISSHTKALAFAMLLAFLHVNCQQTCIDLSRGTSGLYALMHSTWPAHTIIGGGNKQITTGGSYQIMENIEGSIVILANDVVLDLNGFTISGSISPLITVTEGLKNVMIKNGSIEGDASNIGIEVLGGASTILFEDLDISNCLVGMTFTGAECYPVTCCKVDNCFTTNCGSGYELFFAEKTVFEHCQVSCCQVNGFLLYRSRFNKFKDCMAIGIGNDDPQFDAFGFTSFGGFDNLFYECFAENIHKDGQAGDGTWCKKAIGFNFGFAYDSETRIELSDYPERESKIIKCLVDSTEVPDGSWYHPMGIRLDSILTDSNEVDPIIPVGDAITVLDPGFTPTSDPQARQVDWSPQCNLIVTAEQKGENGAIKLTSFDGNTLVLTDTVLVIGRPFTVEFSPDGKYVMSGNGNSGLLIYDVKTLQPIVSIPGTGVVSATWFNCSNKIVVSSAEGIRIYFFNGKAVTLSGTIALTNSNVSVTPDDKYLFINPINNASWFVYDLNNLSQVGSLVTGCTSPVMNPVVCCGTYYVAGIEFLGAAEPGSSVRVFAFDGEQGTLTPIVTLALGAVRVQPCSWHPSGKYLAVPTNNIGGVGSVEILQFDPQVGTLTPFYSYTPTRVVPSASTFTSLFVDWSPCGDKIVIYGNPATPGTDPDLEVVELGACVSCCVVDSNKVANSSGGQCAIGIFGTSCCNGITRNVAYGNCVNFSQGVYNKYCNGLSGSHTLLGNWSIPPY